MNITTTIPEMSKIERVEFVDATKQYGHPDEPTCLRVVFKLIPGPNLQWSELFEQKLKQINEKKNNSNSEFYSEKNENPSVWKFSQTGDDEELIEVYCHSAGEIESLHETLKNTVRRTNDEYPKFIAESEADREKELAEKNEIERLKKTLKSEI
jgi:hypothetical protein